ncbi:hypothetical protein EMCG_03178, partial [[Emmonsia] crescens]
MSTIQSRKEIKNSRARLKRRKDKLFENANEAHLLCHAVIYALVGRDEKYFSYNSSAEKNWPPSRAQL